MNIRIGTYIVDRVYDVRVRIHNACIIVYYHYCRKDINVGLSRYNI